MNVGDLPYEEIAIFFLDDPESVAQPCVEYTFGHFQPEFKTPTPMTQRGASRATEP